LLHEQCLSKTHPDGIIRSAVSQDAFAERGSDDELKVMKRREIAPGTLQETDTI